MFTVYAVREKNTRGVQKFGYTQNLKQRIYNLSTGNWRGIELTMVMGTYDTKEEAKRVEDYLKAVFADSHISREWYEATVAQLRQIRIELTYGLLP